MFSKILPAFFTALVLVGCCTSGKQPAVRKVAVQPTESLHAYFLKADFLSQADHWDQEAWSTLKNDLHRQLREQGDRVFARALAKESYGVQIAVVNCMGFVNPSDYDEYPKTQYVLSAAPKT